MLEDFTLDSQPQDVPQSIKFDYIKSNLFRVIAPDGASATSTPQGKIFLSLFSERFPIPRQVIHEVLPDGNLGKEIDKVSRDSLVREVEIGVVIDVELAERISRTLLRIVEVSKSNLNDTVVNDSNQ